ncbi:hypothetical protein [Roseimicrobium sp. ORNL1]|uniref:hypothetical protein n=1 Tax=Roseimicrobium sp. ORNL1 TaxID=2711231 RepID=UPI0013E0EEA9|nr:hypothetical protein [Roseimicrobium sp. ORNL1]QIF01980.1 hypothetical protein G5S37_10705 [Roseimicrobium sp. ORNL1]
MPRHTKLLIALTLLVLLAIPAIYVACTWSTENPLRFEAVRLEKDPSPVGSTKHDLLHLTVRNVSKLPVHLSFASLHQKNPHDAAADAVQIGALMPDLQDRPEKGPRPLLLPPGGSMQCIAYISVDGVGAPEALRDIDVGYYWRSDTAERVCSLWTGYSHVLMGPAKSRILRHGDAHHRSPLILPATASPQPSSGQGSGK